MKNTIASLAGAGLLIAGLAGCANPPSAEIEAAQTALAAADEAEADVYAAELYQSAQDSMTVALELIDAEDAESGFSRDYEAAKSLLAYVTVTATEAASQVEAGKAALQPEVEALIAQAEQAVAQAQTLTSPATGPESSVELVSGSDASTAAADLTAAKAALLAGDLAQARELSQSALEKANALIEAVPPADTTASTPRS